MRLGCARALGEMRATLAQGGAAAAPVGKALERARDVQVDQGRVTNDIVQFMGGIHQVFDSYVLGRVGVGSETTIDRLLPIYHEALAVRSDEEVFPAALYEKIVAEKRASRLYDDKVLGALLDIMDLGRRATTELSPAVGKSIAAWAAEGPHDPAELERAEKLSTVLAAVLAEIDQKMQRWGDLNLLIEMAREVRNTEDNLSRDPAGTKRLAPK